MARPRGFDEQQVLTAARDAFWAKGYAGTSMADLTEATGLGKGSLYGAFGDKHALFMRIFDDFCVETGRDLVTMLEGPDDEALTRLTGYVHRVGTRSAATESCGDPNGCLLAKATAELASTDAGVAARAQEAFGLLEQQLTAAITGAQRAGDLDPAADPRVTARVLLATLRGMESLGKAGMPSEQLREIADAAVAALPLTVAAA